MSPTPCQFCGLIPRNGENVCGSQVVADLGCEHVGSAVLTSGPFAGMRRNHYRAILADAPWTFETRADTGKDRSPEQHYDCMTLEELKALPVRDIAAKDCVLFFWVIDTHIRMALDVLDAWGFTYKTRAFHWAKLNKGGGKMLAGDPKAFFTGMGFWSRANPEDCWLATRGQPKRRETGKGVRRLIIAERREHSRKPDDIYERIETLVEGPYAELFSRSNRPGWDAMGNERGKFSKTPAELLADRLADDLI